MVTTRNVKALPNLKSINSSSQWLNTCFQPREKHDEEDELDLEEDKQNEWEEMFVETEASKHIQQGDIAIIKTGDDHPYY